MRRAHRLPGRNFSPAGVRPSCSPLAIMAAHFGHIAFGEVFGEGRELGDEGVARCGADAREGIDQKEFRSVEPFGIGGGGASNVARHFLVVPIDIGA